MSLHRSLRTKPAALNQHRNVLTRAERIERLRSQERYSDDQSPLGLVKVANRQVIAAKKEKAPKAEGEATATGTAAAPAAAAADSKAAKGGKK